MNQIVKMIFAAALIATSSSAIAAPGQVVMQGDVRLEKIVVEKGASRVELQEPNVVVPGDKLLFTTRYTNSGSSAVQNFVVTNPLPSAVRLVADNTGGYTVSVDGGKTWGALASLKVSDSKGGLRAATELDVTHLRWVIANISAGASGKVEYHAIVR